MHFVSDHCTCIYSSYFVLLSILATMQCKLSEQLAVFHIDCFQMFCAVVDIIFMKAFSFFLFLRHHFVWLLRRRYYVAVICLLNCLCVDAKYLKANVKYFFDQCNGMLLDQ